MQIAVKNSISSTALTSIIIVMLKINRIKHTDLPQYLIFYSNSAL